MTSKVYQFYRNNRFYIYVINTYPFHKVYSKTEENSKFEIDNAGMVFMYGRCKLYRDENITKKKSLIAK